MQAKWPLAAMAVLVCAGPARADPLTCAVYKDRLNAALLASAAQNADAMAFRMGFTDASHHVRYDWGDEGIGGALRCGPSDEFEEFGINMRLKAKDTFASDLNRFMTTQGASICALASDSAPACKDFGRSLLENALAQMGRNATRGAQTPSGLADRSLSSGATAEVTAAPALVTFVLGVGRGETLDAVRQGLPTSDEKPPR